MTYLIQNASRRLRGRRRCAVALQCGISAARLGLVWLECRLLYLAVPRPSLQWTLTAARDSLFAFIAVLLIRWVALSPLCIGVKQYYLQLYRQSGAVDWRIVFSVYRAGRYGICLRLSALLGAIRIAVYAVCLLPAALMIALGHALNTLSGSGALYEVLRLMFPLCGAALMPTGIVAGAVWLLGFMPSPYLVRSRTDSALGIIKRAYALMYARRLQTVRLYTQAMPKLALCIAGLPYGWISAWFETVRAGTVLAYGLNIPDTEEDATASPPTSPDKNAQRRAWHNPTARRARARHTKR